jgi:hypothetical protein
MPTTIAIIDCRFPNTINWLVFLADQDYAVGEVRSEFHTARACVCVQLRQTSVL